MPRVKAGVKNCSQRIPRSPRGGVARAFRTRRAGLDAVLGSPQGHRIAEDKQAADLRGVPQADGHHQRHYGGNRAGLSISRESHGCWAREAGW